MVALHFFSSSCDDLTTIVADCGCQLFTSIYSHSTQALESTVLFPLVTHSGLQVSSSLLFAQYHSWLLTVDSRVILSLYSVVIPLPQAFCAYHIWLYFIFCAYTFQSYFHHTTAFRWSRPAYHALDSLLSSSWTHLTCLAKYFPLFYSILCIASQGHKCLGRFSSLVPISMAVYPWPQLPFRVMESKTQQSLWIPDCLKFTELIYLAVFWPQVHVFILQHKFQLEIVGAASDAGVRQLAGIFSFYTSSHFGGSVSLTKDVLEECWHNINVGTAQCWLINLPV